LLRRVQVSTAETMSANVAGQNQASSFCDQDDAERDLWKRSAQVFACLAIRTS
jgi:hypothetical protein